MSLSLSDLSQEVLATQYAVRGPIVTRARELERSGKAIIYCNIGNPQALGQKPLSYVRQTLALMQYPELALRNPQAFPPDVLERAAELLKSSGGGLGAYSESKGLRIVREAVARFIAKRDSDGSLTLGADPESIYLTDGASKGVQSVLRLLIASDRDGIMIPIPQYPLYSASITLYGGRQVGYYLDESSGWSLSRQELERAHARAVAEGVTVKAICVINPGNPTGAVLDRDNIAMVIAFAKEHGLSILADEVYQQNIYRPEDKFVSFARVLAELGDTDVCLFSFHSCSKGFHGECGQRGGYLEARNVSSEVMAQITKLQSIALCANLSGQVLVYLMVRPPEPGEASFNLYEKEKREILGELAARARLLAEGLNRIPGYSCAPITGAMYAYPRIKLPFGRSDSEYCLALLEETGICLVPGEGFGQVEGSAHFRTTILPPREQLHQVLEKLENFHRRWR
ncbi:MAG: aminotransferase class I/II-fold pyridoxal phosphate-dependent enzyme [Spirochaetia bacterium]|nr:aminotransferase class I/II-fold pyridoxal phosphate-dependent enzyme [Spirochaetia bacterium]MCE1208990.1 aminotransferase class I/II-fold pyridoxal phosphate-dependent enzyme [Spirochaetia bacterium]